MRSGAAIGVLLAAMLLSAIAGRCDGPVTPTPVVPTPSMIRTPYITPVLSATATLKCVSLPPMVPGVPTPDVYPRVTCTPKR